MIQRIQSFYLLLVALLMLAMLFVPFADFNNETASYIFKAKGVYTHSDPPTLVYAAWSLFALLLLTVILPVITIFKYKKRILQMRLCLLNGILIVAFYGVFFIYWWLLSRDLSVETTFKATLAMPAVALILDYMAARCILQDELLVRSESRIR